MITTNDSLAVIAAGVAAFAIVLLGVAVRRARYARRAAYYVTRRQSQDTANRQLLWSILLLVVATTVFIASRIMPQEGGGLGHNAPSQNNAQPVVVITALVPTPSLTPPAPPATPTPAVEPIPATPAPTTQPAPPAQPVQPTSETTGTQASASTPAPPALNPKHLTMRAIAAGVDASGLPVNPSLQFGVGTPAVYVFFDFQNVPAGVRLRHNWFRDGGSVYFESFPWDRPDSGNATIAWTPPHGFDAGMYEVRVFIDDQLQFVANFEVK